MRFEWDPKKAESNSLKHGVSFSEALAAFSDPMARVFDDEDHSIGEKREILIGHSRTQRLLLVCFAAREESIRIFSARKVSRQERRDYEENAKP